MPAGLMASKPAFKAIPDGHSPFGFADSYDNFSDDEDEPVSQQVPLFQHEAGDTFGDVSYGGGVVEDYHHESRTPEDKDIDSEDIDINDPTLERFPSNREAIINTVRKLESGKRQF